jgi:hypothetical protein
MLVQSWISNFGPDTTRVGGERQERSGEVSQVMQDLERARFWKPFREWPSLSMPPRYEVNDNQARKTWNYSSQRGPTIIHLSRLC